MTTKNPWKNFPHLLSAKQLNPKFIVENFFPLVDEMRDVAERGGSDLLSRHSIFLLFYEASTRTSTSFHRAAKLLGADVKETENARNFSSAVKGETLEDTIRIMNGYFYSLIVLRYDQVGGAARAAKCSQIPIINAGDGSGEHPTQALLDLYTIHQHYGSFKGLTVALVGDLFASRTVHSLTTLLAKIGGVKLLLVSPSVLRLHEDVKAVLDKANCEVKETCNLLDVAAEADVVYLTRLQKERLEEAKDRNTWRGTVRVSVDEEILRVMRENSIIMHPLPRSKDFKELPEEFDGDPRVKIFEQAQNGLFVRMALLKLILG